MEDLPAGPVAIKVTARKILRRFGPQKYALVVLGRFTGALVSPQNPDAASRTAPKDAACSRGAVAFSSSVKG